MPHRDLVVIGASAGGVEALRALVASLPRDLAAAVLIVLHLPPDSPSALAQILSRASGRRVTKAVSDQRLEPGLIMVAPAGAHLVVHGNQAKLLTGPRVNAHRPSIDPLFFSAARWKGPQTIGVILSGTLDDGSAGMRAIVRLGGRGIVQDPDEALYPDMPMHALREAPTCEALPLAKIGARLGELTREEVEDGGGELGIEPQRETEQDMQSSEEPIREGRPSAFSCPDCHGVLWEVSNGEVARYRCRVGHAFSPVTLASQQEESVQDALWTAYRALRESASLSRRLADRARDQGLEGSERQYRARELDASAKAESIEKVLMQAASDAVSHAEP